jgi:hypothetical protein
VEQLQLALEASDITIAAMTARMKLPDIEERVKPKRHPIPDHIPRIKVELAPMPIPVQIPVVACPGSVKMLPRSWMMSPAAGKLAPSYHAGFKG